jgi:hypothetical protein
MALPGRCALYKIRILMNKSGLFNLISLLEHIKSRVQYFPSSVVGLQPINVDESDIQSCYINVIKVTKYLIIFSSSSLKAFKNNFANAIIH